MIAHETERFLRAHTPGGTDFLSTPDLTGFTPSPTKRVRFADGEILLMNRAQRRRNHLYGDRIKRAGK